MSLSVEDMFLDLAHKKHLDYIYKFYSYNIYNIIFMYITVDDIKMKSFLLTQLIIGMEIKK